MTQRSIHSQNAQHRPHGRVFAVRVADTNASLQTLIKLAPITAMTAAMIAATLILVLVLITGHASAEYGFA